jgi:hypothetical protein
MFLSRQVLWACLGIILIVADSRRMAEVLLFPTLVEAALAVYQESCSLNSVLATFGVDRRRVGDLLLKVPASLPKDSDDSRVL